MRSSLPSYLRAGSPPVFPDPRQTDREGLVAVGGDLSPDRLLAAYRAGIFPWYEEGIPPLWWSPDPRALMSAADLHVPRRLARRIRQRRFRLTWNLRFREVIVACGERRPEGTWITADMITAYLRLHRLGHAHSLELWHGGDLVGGIYGVQVGGLFAGESMFSVAPDASKIALVACVRSVFRAGIGLFDVQFMTPHLRGLGARECSRLDYLDLLARVRDQDVDLAGLTIGF